METYGEIYQEFKVTDICPKGRAFGYAQAVRDVLKDGVKVGVAAWVQRAVECKKQGFKDFGPRVRATEFSTYAEARQWMHQETARKVRTNAKGWQRNGHRIV